MIVMELVPGGSLLNYLRTSADKLATKALLGMGVIKKIVGLIITEILQACARMQQVEWSTWSPSSVSTGFASSFFI